MTANGMSLGCAQNKTLRMIWGFEKKKKPLTNPCTTTTSTTTTTSHTTTTKLSSEIKKTSYCIQSRKKEPCSFDFSHLNSSSATVKKCTVKGLKNDQKRSQSIHYSGPL